jgi:hypothetical protein
MGVDFCADSGFDDIVGHSTFRYPGSIKKIIQKVTFGNSLLVHLHAVVFWTFAFRTGFSCLAFCKVH